MQDGPTNGLTKKRLLSLRACSLDIYKATKLELAIGNYTTKVVATILSFRLSFLWEEEESMVMI